MSFSLHPAQQTDIPKMAQIAHEAFQKDPHTQLKSLPDYGGYNHEETMNECLPSWLNMAENKGRTLKATDDKTGEILGWICWGLRGYDEKVVVGAQPQNVGESEVKTGIARMKALVGDDMTRWMATLMPQGAKCLFIISIVVSPEHQGRGIGSALIRNGTSQVDKDGVYCWVHSSEAGAPVFAKEGFKEVGTLEFDMDEFVKEEDQKNGRIGEKNDWGVYRFRYMKYEAQSAQ